MTDITTVIGLAKYSRRKPTPDADIIPPYAALIFWVLLGICAILLAPEGASSLAEACAVAICGP
ncbi:MAG TPA: hypothetical protein VM689_07190 [Aliidongia sp.]|nr:hypothetical protein [Aliidongia sp.]